MVGVMRFIEEEQWNDVNWLDHDHLRLCEGEGCSRKGALRRLNLTDKPQLCDRCFAERKP